MKDILAVYGAACLAMQIFFVLKIWFEARIEAKKAEQKASKFSKQFPVNSVVQYCPSSLISGHMYARVSYFLTADVAVVVDYAEKEWLAREEELTMIAIAGEDGVSDAK